MMKATKFFSALLLMLAVCTMAEARTYKVNASAGRYVNYPATDYFQPRLPPPPPRPRFLPGPPPLPHLFGHRSSRRPEYRHRRVYRSRRVHRY